MNAVDIDPETNHPCTISYEAGFEAGKGWANAEAADAEEVCDREAEKQDDPEGYRDGFWNAYHKNA